jgi:hypothetical protein
VKKGLGKTTAPQAMFKLYHRIGVFALFFVKKNVRKNEVKDMHIALCLVMGKKIIFWRLVCEFA